MVGPKFFLEGLCPKTNRKKCKLDKFHGLWLMTGKRKGRWKTYKIGVACSSSTERKREGLEVFDKLYALHGGMCGYSIGSVLK